MAVAFRRSTCRGQTILPCDATSAISDLKADKHAFARPPGGGKNLIWVPQVFVGWSFRDISHCANQSRNAVADLVVNIEVGGRYVGEQEITRIDLLANKLVEPVSECVQVRPRRNAGRSNLTYRIFRCGNDGFGCRVGKKKRFEASSILDYRGLHPYMRNRGSERKMRHLSTYARDVSETKNENHPKLFRTFEIFTTNGRLSSPTQSQMAEIISGRKGRKIYQLQWLIRAR